METNAPFPKSQLHLDLIPSRLANDIVEKYHYLHRKVYSANLIAYQVTLDGCPPAPGYPPDVGVIMFGFPVFHTKRGLVGQEQPMVNGELLDLSRMYMPDAYPKNTESRVIGVALRLLRRDWPTLHKQQPRAIITFADTEFSHQGTIYKATGFTYLGYTRGRKATAGSTHGRWDRSPNGPTKDSTAKNRMYNAGMVEGERKEVYLKLLDPTVTVDFDVLRASYKQAK